MTLILVPRLESTPVASEICTSANKTVTHQLDSHSAQERFLRRAYVQIGLVHSRRGISDPDVKELQSAIMMSRHPSKETDREQRPTTVFGGGQVPGVRDQTSVLTASGAVLYSATSDVSLDLRKSFIRNSYSPPKVRFRRLHNHNSGGDTGSRKDSEETLTNEAHRMSA